MNNHREQTTEGINQNTLLTLNQTLALNWQRILGGSQNDKTHAERVFQKFTQLVESNHREQRSLKFYADKLNMTKSNLRKICQQEIGFPPSCCINTRLMLEACAMLKDPKAIKEIAFELGFENPKYFARFFKKHGGLPPDSFRKFILKPNDS